MSVLLRHPATVPALFSRVMDAEAPTVPGRLRWRHLDMGPPLLAIAGWAIVTLIDVPLVKAATVVVVLALPG